MHRTALAVLLALALAGCVIQPPSDAAAGPPHPGRTALSVIGTPFFIAFKIPACIVSAAIAAPLAGVAQLAGTAQGASIEGDLGDGLESNCGPPYVLTP
jgi:hypothetical protein